MSGNGEPRRYRKQQRARKEEDTRRCITEAVVELHRTVGPANTRVTEVAERAGVSRMTVYNHFPTDADLIEACSTHWAVRNPTPDPASWAAEPDPTERLRRALTELYAWCAATADMMGNVLRDAPIVQALGDLMEERWSPYVDGMVAVLAAGWGEKPGSRDVRAALRLAVDFGTWQVLADAGLDPDRAAELATRMVACAGVPLEIPGEAGRRLLTGAG
jgi:AcrR family transcriptional regulator